MDKKNLIIAFLLGALLMQPVRAEQGGIEIATAIKSLASAMIKSAKIIGLGASTAHYDGYIYPEQLRHFGTSYWDFVKRIPEKVE